jgi:hypothetical protein
MYEFFLFRIDSDKRESGISSDLILNSRNMFGTVRRGPLSSVVVQRLIYYQVENICCAPLYTLGWWTPPRRRRLHPKHTREVAQFSSLKQSQLTSFITTTGRGAARGQGYTRWCCVCVRVYKYTPAPISSCCASSSLVVIDFTRPSTPPLSCKNERRRRFFFLSSPTNQFIPNSFHPTHFLPPTSTFLPIEEEKS